MGNTFYLYSYNTERGKETFFGDISVRFEKDGLVLRDGYEHDAEGYTISEIENYYRVDSAEYQKIIPLITDEYKNESILAEYENANIYYENLAKPEEKLLFILFLHYFKPDKKIDNIIKMLKDNGINYKHDTSGY